MHILCTRTIRRAFLGDGWGLKRALEAHGMVRACLMAQRVARVGSIVRGHVAGMRAQTGRAAA